MEGLILNEDFKYVTFMCPVFNAIGMDVIRDLNWRVLDIECGGPIDRTYSFEGKRESWLSGDKLANQVELYPEIQWWWGLLQGFDKSIEKSMLDSEPDFDIQDDASLWKNPVTMRSPLADIEIEAFDSSKTIVIAKEQKILDRLKEAFPKYELLSKYNSSEIYDLMS